MVYKHRLKSSLSTLKMLFAMISIFSPYNPARFVVLLEMSSYGVVPDSGARSNGVIVFYAYALNIYIVYEQLMSTRG